MIKLFMRIVMWQVQNKMSWVCLDWIQVQGDSTGGVAVDKRARTKDSCRFMQIHQTGHENNAASLNVSKCEHITAIYSWHRSFVSQAWSCSTRIVRQGTEWYARTPGWLQGPYSWNPWCRTSASGPGVVYSTTVAGRINSQICGWLRLLKSHYTYIILIQLHIWWHIFHVSIHIYICIDICIDICNYMYIYIFTRHTHISIYIYIELFLHFLVRISHIVPTTQSPSVPITPPRDDAAVQGVDRLVRVAGDLCLGLLAQRRSSPQRGIDPLVIPRDFGWVEWHHGKTIGKP